MVRPGCSSCYREGFHCRSLPPGARTRTHTRTHPCTWHSCPSMGTCTQTCLYTEACIQDTSTETYPHHVYLQTRVHESSRAQPGRNTQRPCTQDSPKGTLRVHRLAEGHTATASSPRAPPVCTHTLSSRGTLQPLTSPSVDALEELPAWQL